MTTDPHHTEPGPETPLYASETAQDPVPGTERRPGGEFGPQTGAQSLGGEQEAAGDLLRERMETAIAELSYYERDDARLIADAVMAVRDRFVEQLAAGRATWKAKAEEIERDRDQHAAAIDRVRALADRIETGAPWTANHDDLVRRIRDALQPPAGQPPLEHAANRANAEDCPACKAATNPPPYPFICPGPETEPAPHDGPSVAEAAADDRAHWTTKYDQP
jgi:hypothetical protein